MTFVYKRQGKLVGVSPRCLPSSSLRASTENTPLIPEAPIETAP